MIKTRKAATYALTAFLLLGTTNVAFSQTPAPSTPVTTADRDNDFDWGWLGLLGLIGLAGLMRRDRAHPVHHNAGVGTTAR
jgi:MYXO-CTERM domain-containing protein